MDTSAMSSSEKYQRTRILSIHVERYRSLRNLSLTDLPELIVFHGPNGVGKSNIMRVPALLFSWVANLDPLPSIDSPRPFNTKGAYQVLGIRPDDFTRGELPNMLLSAEVALGRRAAGTTGSDEASGILRLTARLQDRGNDRLELWFEKADLNGKLSLFPDKNKDPRLAEQRDDLKRKISFLETQLATLHKEQDSGVFIGAGPTWEERIKKLEGEIEETKKQQKELDTKMSDESLLPDRIRHALLKNRLLHRSTAARHIQDEKASAAPTRSANAHTLFQTDLFQAATSEDRGRRRAFNEFADRLSLLDIFGDQRDITLAPIVNRTFEEYQLLVSTRETEDIPVKNLGTGQQQAIMLLADTHIADCPIIQIEEPEAHLHRDLMGRVARYLKDVVENESEPLFDQLWISTHHHQFAVAKNYFDVRLEEGRTMVEKQPRPMAAAHFYEPGPLWDALRALVADGVPEDKPIFRDERGQNITAGQILESMNGDRRLAEEYVRMATQAVVMSFKKARSE